MKRTARLTAALAAILITAGCGNSKPAAEISAPAESAGNAVTEAAAETERLPKVTRTPIYTGICDYPFYLEDTSPGENGTRVYPGAIMRLSSGAYDSSGTNPELFDAGTLTYSGEHPDLGTVVLIKAGDKLSGLTASEAAAVFSAPENGAAEEYAPLYTRVSFDGEVRLSGVLRYYAAERDGYSPGDLVFIPDSSYKGLPVPVDFSGAYDDYCVTDFWSAADGSSDGSDIFSDAPRLRIGNLNTDYSDDPALYELLNGGETNCTKKVKLTLTDLRLEWDMQSFAEQGCTARLKKSDQS